MDLPSLDHHWTCVNDKTVALRQRIANAQVDDQHALRAEAANIMQAASNLFELEIRRVVR